MAGKLKVGFIGLGSMGVGMASCLAKAGFSVTGFDINPDATARLVHEGGQAAESPRATAERVDVLVMVVATSTQASSALFDTDTGAIAGLADKATILFCITAAPEYVGEARARLEAEGRSDVGVVDCPISGGETRAWKGDLSLLCSGQDADIAHVRDVLACLGSRLHVIPGGIGAGSSAKMVHQILVGVHILAAVEMMGLAHVAGLDAQAVYDVVMGGDAASWVFGQRAAHIIDEGKVPASSLMIITKDFRMLNASARKNRVSLPLTSLAYQIFVQAYSAECDAADDCSVLDMYLFRARSRRRSDSPKRAGSKIDKAAITDLLIGIHAAAAVEALTLARRLGVGRAVLREVVLDAAGSSRMFDRVCAELQGEVDISLRSIRNSGEITRKMASAVEAADALNYPVFLSSTALQQCYHE